MDAIFTLYALTAIRKSCETLKGIGLLMNDPHLAEQEGGSIITSLTNTIKDLRSRLAEVEKELQSSKEMIFAYEQELGKTLNPEWVKVGKHPIVGMIEGMTVHEAPRASEEKE